MRSAALSLSILAALGGVHAQAQSCLEPLPGLVVWWDADDVKWHPHHSQVPHALDSTGRLTGPALRIAAPHPDADTWTPQFLTGMVGQAFDYGLTLPLRGTLSSIAPHHPELDFTSAMSLELWVKARPVPGRDEFVVLRKASDFGTAVGHVGSTGYLLYGRTASGALRWHIGHGAGQSSFVEGATNVLDNNWHHVVATFDAARPSGQLALYVDGALDGVADALGPITTNAEPVFVGLAEYWRPLDGALDEVRLYDRALAPVEVASLRGQPLRCRPAYPVRAFHLAEFGSSSDPNSKELAVDGDVMAVAKRSEVLVLRRAPGGGWDVEQTIPAWSGSCGLARVDVSGDVLVIGWGQQGCIYGGIKVFRYDGVSWVEEFRRDDTFGLQKTVAAHGDVIAVGRQGYNSIPDAYVTLYRYDGATWVEEATLTRAGGASTFFSYSLDLAQDLLVVGAFLDGTVASNGGAVSVYRRVAGTWAQTMQVTPDMLDPGRASYAGFGLGRHVALDGERLLVGAVNARPTPPGQPAGEYGAAYVVDLAGGGFAVEGALLPSPPAPTFASGTLYESRVGRCVALDGDLALVAAPGDTGDMLVPDRAGVGASYLFARRGGAWREVARLRSGEPGVHEQAQSVALSEGHAYAVSGVGGGGPLGDGRVYDYGDFRGAVNSARPLAHAGADIPNVPEGEPVTLDGSASSDADGDALTFTWTQSGGPPVALSDAHAVSPTFLAPIVGLSGATLTFLLVVDDGQLASDPDPVDVTVSNVNRAPVADAGADQEVSEGGASPVRLDGAASYDLDGDALNYAWTQVLGAPVTLSVDPLHAAVATFSAPNVGAAGETLVFALRVFDGVAWSEADEVVVRVTDVNHAPLAVVEPLLAVEEGAPVILSGVGSSDPDSDPLGFEWVQLPSAGPAVTLSNPFTAETSFVAPDVVGEVELVFRLTVTDGRGGFANAEVRVAVRDVASPVNCVGARADVPLLWPPNHKMVTVRVVGVQGLDPGSVTITILNVWQDEPTEGLGGGDTGPADAAILGDRVLLRAERSGQGNGRVYHVEFRARDGAGAECTGTVRVAVPHDRAHEAVDDGPLYDSRG